MNWVVLLTLLQVGVTSEEDVLITLSGSSRIDHLVRHDGIQELRAALNGSGTEKSENFMRGETNLALDMDLGSELRFKIELEAPAWYGGTDHPLAEASFSDPVIVDKLFLDVGSFLTPDLALRIGRQDFSYRLRPHGEPFFLGTGMSESFFSGTSTFVRNTADRDRSTPGGIALRYNPSLVLEAELWLAIVKEGGAAHNDETLGGLFLNGLLSERTSWNLMAALVAGEGSDREIWTIGLGLDHYVTPSKSL